MRRETPPPALQETVNSVVRSLTSTQRDYLLAPPADPAAGPPSDADFLAEMTAILGIARRMQYEAQSGKPVSAGGDNSWDEAAVKTLTLKASAFVTACESSQDALPKGRKELTAWLRGEGTEARTLFTAFKKLLQARLQELAEEEARRTAPKQPYVKPAPKERSNEEILADAIALKMRQAAPGGDVGRVKSVLVVAGKEYHGSNGKSGEIGAVTRSLLTERVDVLEKWKTFDCAEVSALHTFLTDRKFADAEAVVTAFTGGGPGTITDAHIATIEARTDDRSGDRYWVKRTPCNNCQQWLKTLRIAVDTKGALI